MNREKVTALLYVLMRDHLPVGTVTKAVNELRDIPDEAKIDLTNKYLEAHAMDLLDRLR